MRASRVGAIALRQFYLVRGSTSRLLPLFVWVTIDVVLWGFITRWLGTVTTSRVPLAPALLGAVLLWDFLQRVMQGVTMAFLEDVWSRNFLNVFASPVTIGEYVSGLVLSSIATSALGLVVMLVVARAAFGLSLAVYGAPVVAFGLVLFLTGIALGILGSAIVLRLGPAAEWFIWPIPALVSPFAGVFYPITTLPEWMQWISRALPPSYVFESMRAVVAGRPVGSSAIALGGGLAVLYVILAALGFGWVQRYAVRTGLIGRYAAESVN